MLSHRLDTEPLVALPPLSLPFRAAVEEAAAAAGSMFWEAMSTDGAVTAGDRQTVGQRQRQMEDRLGDRHRHTALIQRINSPLNYH